MASRKIKYDKEKIMAHLGIRNIEIEVDDYLNDEVEINPGILTKTKDGRYTCEPIITKLLSFESDKIKGISPTCTS